LLGRTGYIFIISYKLCDTMCPANITWKVDCANGCEILRIIITDYCSICTTNNWLVIANKDLKHGQMKMA
jgi:hypothetical protein